MEYNDLEYIDNELENIKQDIEAAYRYKDYYKAICLLRFITNMYYKINNKLTDDFIEDVVKKISHEYLGDTVIENTNNKCVVFYDGFGLLNRGLANIYIKALCELEYNITWILFEYAPDVKKIKERYQDFKNISFTVIPKLNIMERMKMLQGKILKIIPAHIFVYTMPDDVVGLGMFSTVRGSVNRYLINLTDHAYWLGKNSADYFLVFRNIGCNAAIKYRNIEKERIIMLPFYPENRDRYEYEGMPFENTKEFIFSGGSSYKIEGATEYPMMVERILEKYEDIQFVYACNNPNSVLMELKKHFPNQFYIIPERKDLDAILSHAKFYMHTYPVCGGLMIQYAVKNQCVPFGLCLAPNGITDPKTVLLDSGNSNASHADVNKVYEYFDKLMSDNEFYVKEKEELAGSLITEEDFTAQLSKAMTLHKTDFQIVEEDVDLSLFFDINSKQMTKEKYFKYVENSRNEWVKGRYSM